MVSQCVFYQRGMTVWDDKSFHYIDSTGTHTYVDKKQLLHCLSADEIRVIMVNLRRTAHKEEDWVGPLKNLITEREGGKSGLSTHILLESK